MRRPKSNRARRMIQVCFPPFQGAGVFWEWCEKLKPSDSAGFIPSGKMEDVDRLRWVTGIGCAMCVGLAGGSTLVGMNFKY